MEGIVNNINQALIMGGLYNLTLKNHYTGDWRDTTRAQLIFMVYCSTLDTKLIVAANFAVFGLMRPNTCRYLRIMEVLGYLDRVGWGKYSISEKGYNFIESFTEDFTRRLEKAGINTVGQCNKYKR